MYVAAVAFSVAQFIAIFVLVSYVSVANRKNASPFTGIFGIAGASFFLGTILGVGFMIVDTPVDTTAIFFATICFPLCAVMEVALAYIIGNLVFYPGGSLTMRKPEFSENSFNSGMWIVVPMLTITVSMQLLILLMSDMNPIPFGTIGLLVTLAATHFGYLRFTDLPHEDLSAGKYVMKFLKAGYAVSPSNAVNSKLLAHTNAATWAMAVCMIELGCSIIALVFSFLMPRSLIGSIAIAISSRFILIAPLLLWAQFFMYRDENRVFFHRRGRYYETRGDVATLAVKTAWIPGSDEKAAFLGTVEINDSD